MSVMILDSCQSGSSNISPEGMIDVPGGKVWYRVHGADKPGIPVLVLHGGPGAPHDYLEPVKALSNERPVVFYDQLGCGNSERPSDTNLWKVERFLDELEIVRRELKLDQVHLLGSSWGTMLSVEYVLHRKADGVKSLLLSGPYLSTRRWTEDQQRWISQLPSEVRDSIRKYEAVGDYSAQAYQDAMMAFYKVHLCRLDPWPECLLRTMEKMGTGVYEYMWGPSEFTMTGILREADLTPELGRLSLPVLITCGEFDEATPATSAYYQSLIPGAELHVFRNASHSHQLENPDEFIRVSGDFFRKSEQGR